MGRRRTSVILLAILIGGIIGSALSFILGDIFPPGPVRDFFFKSIKVGFSDLKVDIGFFGFQFGIFIKISILAVVSVFVTIYVLHRL